LLPSIDQEIALAYQDGVVHPENLPYLLTPEKPNDQGILLVHGFGSTPRELRELGNLLLTKNFTVLGVRLPGHGTSPEDLAERTVEEWLSTTERGFHILQQRGLKISAVGLSTGCLLLLQLANQLPLERLVLLAPYLKLRHRLSPYAGFLSWFIPYQVREINEKDQPYYYSKRPLKGVAQLNRLRKSAANQLSSINTATLILSSEGDRTVYPGTAEQLFNKLSSSEKHFHRYGLEVPHVLTADDSPCRQDVLQRTLDFLKKSSPQTEISRHEK